MVFRFIIGVIIGLIVSQIIIWLGNHYSMSTAIAFALILGLGLVKYVEIKIKNGEKK